MNIHIRPFNPTREEYQAVIDIDKVVWPDWNETVEHWQHWDNTRDPKYWFQRYVLEVDGQIVAFGGAGEPHWSYKPGKYFVSITVPPQYEGRGFGSALYDHMVAEITGREPKLELLVANTREDKERGIHFLQQRGFHQVMRFARSMLDVTKFEPQHFAPQVERVQTAGIQLKSVAQLREEYEDWLPRLHDLEWELLQDVPYHDDFTRSSQELFEKRVLGNPNFFPEAWYIAIDGDRWVGMSALWHNGNDGKLETGLTGVARSHRRKGLATALKTAAISYAKSLGYKEIETDNEENNPMYQLNLQLGFRPLPAFLDFVKEID